MGIRKALQIDVMYWVLDIKSKLIIFPTFKVPYFSPEHPHN